METSVYTCYVIVYTDPDQISAKLDKINRYPSNPRDMPVIPKHIVTQAYKLACMCFILVNIGLCLLNLVEFQ